MREGGGGEIVIIIYNARRSDLPADSLPATNVRGVALFSGCVVSAARAVARSVFSEARGGIV